MILTVDPGSITSPDTLHTATRRGDGYWRLSWCPQWRLTHGQAVSGMLIACAAACPDGEAEMRRHVGNWAAELGLDAAEAVAMASGPPREGEAGGGEGSGHG